MNGTGVPWPAYAYVPGQNARHPEGVFDPIRNSVVPGLSEADLASTEAFRIGLLYLDNGYFWEAHEVLEPVWMVCATDSATRQMVQGLIQLANARLKLRMNRPRAVVRLCQIARGHFEAAETLGGRTVLGVEVLLRLEQLGNLAEEAKFAL